MEAITYVSRVADSIIIGVGSSQESNTLENPFSYAERRAMIENSLKLDRRKYTIIPIPDVGNDVLWAKSIVEKMPAFDVIYTNAPREKKIFREVHLKVRNVPLYNRPKYNATEIRRKMSAGDNWQELVPKEAALVIRKADGVRRMVNLTIS